MSDCNVGDHHLPVTIEREAVSFQGFRKIVTIDYREDESELAARREIITGRQSVAIVVYDQKLEKLVMIRQFRLGAQMGTGKGMTVELPAGLIDEGEDPLAAVKRELTEETGLTVGRIEQLCSFLTSPGMTDEVLHLFYGETDARDLVDSAGLADETEQTFPFLVSFEEAMAAVDNNTLHNGSTMVGLLWFARHRERLLGKS